MEHTAKPWRNEAGYVVDQNNMIVSTSWSMIDENGNLVKDIDGNVPNQIGAVQADVNRQLMASAPDLLDELESIINFLENLNCCEEIATLLNRSKSVVAKAKRK
jgi:hypothetical protein